MRKGQRLELSYGFLTPLRLLARLLVTELIARNTQNKQSAGLDFR